MDWFYGINFFILIFALFLAIAAYYAIRAWIGYARLSSDAAKDWEYKRDNKMVDKRLSKDGYVRAYRRAYAPRREAYIATTLAIITLMTPVVLALLSAILYGLWKMDQADGKATEVIVRGKNIGGLTYEPGNMVFGFISFFGILALWTAIAWLAVRRYYRHAPGSLRDEIIRERGEL